MKLIPKKQYYAQLPKKRMSAGVLLFNNKGELFILKPSYKDYWSIPGGAINKNESPYEAAIRELYEETNLKIKKLRLICVEYKKENNYKGEALHFIFYGGKLTKQQITKIKLAETEISYFKFIDTKKAPKVLSDTLGKKLKYCLKAIKNKHTIYMENGKSVGIEK